ncbi:MAG TPA: hypothetical protein VLD59_05215 [Steroidobacteraceae bacterium]|nr:hypothetical protein [Steroidobacteraceae bacterium]
MSLKPALLWTLQGLFLLRVLGQVAALTLPTRRAFLTKVRSAT